MDPNQQAIEAAICFWMKAALQRISYLDKGIVPSQTIGLLRDAIDTLSRSAVDPALFTTAPTAEEAVLQAEVEGLRRENDALLLVLMPPSAEEAVLRAIEDEEI